MFGRQYQLSESLEDTLKKCGVVSEGLSLNEEEELLEAGPIGKIVRGLDSAGKKHLVAFLGADNKSEIEKIRTQADAIKAIKLGKSIVLLKDGKPIYAATMINDNWTEFGSDSDRKYVTMSKVKANLSGKAAEADKMWAVEKSDSVDEKRRMRARRQIEKTFLLMRELDAYVKSYRKDR